MTAPAPARWLTVSPENIPEPLRQGKRFSAWRSEDRTGQPKPAKMPYSPNAPKGASSTDPSHWTTFETACKYAQVAGLDGVMRAFTHEDRLVGTDLDNCLDPTIPEPTIDDLAPWAADIVRREDTYCEISPSGTGVKLWAFGSLPPHGRKRGDVEMYGSVEGQTGPCGRFFTMTGRRLGGTPAAVGYRPDAIAAIHREVFGDAPDPMGAGVERDGPIPALEIGDEDVLRLASESPHNGERFRRLWAGDTSDYASGGNDGASEADAALCELLAYYGGPDEERIDRLFRQGALYREKWERADYRERTIRLALDGKVRFYGDSVRTTAQPSPACACACCDHAGCAELARVRRLLLDRDDLVEYQQVVIRQAHSEIEQERALRARDRRLRLAEQRLRRCSNFSPGQKDTIVAVATIAPPLANTHQTDAPIITRDMVAEFNGAHAQSVGGNLKVFDLPGSPIKRLRKIVGTKALTVFQLAVQDPAEIIEAMATLGEQLDKRPTRPTNQRCPKGCDAGVMTVCAGCGTPVSEQRPARNASETLLLGNEPPHSVLVGTYRERNAPVAPDELSLRRAQAAQATGGRAPDKWKQLQVPKAPPDHCEVHHRALSYPEMEDGGCSWCVTASAASETFMGVPAAMGGSE